MHRATEASRRVAAARLTQTQTDPLPADEQPDRRRREAPITALPGLLSRDHEPSRPRRVVFTTQPTTRLCRHARWAGGIPRPFYAVLLRGAETPEDSSRPILRGLSVVMTCRLDASHD